jgi:DNA polymerase III epsilon subunit-like protein
MDSYQKQLLISVDVETSGPTPSAYSLLSIGACLVFDPSQQFYAELQPISDAYTDEARAVSKLDLDTLKAQGLPPQEAMQRFADWVQHVVPGSETPIFVAFNAPFDWMFVSYYFHRYLQRNPFGHKALDIKAYYMGQYNTQWDQTGFNSVSKHFGFQVNLPHNALGDAMIQGEVFRSMLDAQEQR